MNIDSKMKKTYEVIDIEAAKYIYATYLNDKPAFKTLIYKRNERNKEGSTWDINQYHQQLMKWLKKAIDGGDGVMKTSYYRKEGDFGRQILAKGLFGVQRLQRDLRALLCKMTDYDIVNSHYTFLLDIGNKYELSTKYIQQYCDAPEDVRSNVNKDKYGMIAIIYQDEPHNFQNKYLRKLAAEIKVIRDRVVKERDDIQPTKGSENPNSSVLAKLIQGFEDQVIQTIIDLHNIDDVVKMYDGFMTNTTLDLDEVNKYIVEQMKVNVQLKVKTPECPIIIPEDFEYVDPAELEELALAALSDRVKVFNDNNVFIRSSCRYYCMEGQWVGLSPQQFNTLHANQAKVEVDGKKEKFVEWWIENHRNDYTKRDFYPYNPNHWSPTVPDGVFNCFTPFKRVGREGSPSKLIELFETLTFNLAEGNEELAKFLRYYIAHLIQKPWELPETILALYGNGGTGKDTLIYTIIRLIDDAEYVKTTGNQSQGLGRFNSMLDGCLFADFNEGDGKDAVEGLSKLKNNSTAKSLPIERKGVDVVAVKHYTRYCVKSNNQNFAIVEEDDRRMCVMLATKTLSANWSICPEDTTWGGNKPGSMKAGQKGSGWFFGPYYELLEDEDAVDGLFYYLDKMDLSNFNPRIFPHGEAYKENQAKNYKPHIPWLKEFIKGGDPMKHHGIDFRAVKRNNTKNLDLLCPKDALFAEFNSWCMAKNIINKAVDSEPKLTRELKNMDPDLQTNARPGKQIGNWGRPLCIRLNFERLQDILDQSYPSGNVEEEIIEEEILDYVCDFTNGLDD